MQYDSLHEPHTEQQCQCQFLTKRDVELPENHHWHKENDEVLHHANYCSKHHNRCFVDAFVVMGICPQEVDLIPKGAQWLAASENDNSDRQRIRNDEDDRTADEVDESL